MESATAKSNDTIQGMRSTSTAIPSHSSHPLDTEDHIASDDDQISTLPGRLEDYLQLLDLYMEQRKTLTNQLSNGYMALSKANFHAGPGRRFGADWFDTRMRAAMRVAVTHGPDNLSDWRSVRRGYSRPQGRSLKRTSDDGVSSVDDISDEKPKEVDGTVKALASDLAGLAIKSNQAKHQRNGGNEIHPPPADNAPNEHKKDEEEKEDTEIILDPLRQFGLLVPQALRQTQTLFTNAAETVVQLVALDAQMKQAEKMIYKIKRADATLEEKKEESSKDAKI